MGDWRGYHGSRPVLRGIPGNVGEAILNIGPCEDACEVGLSFFLIALKPKVE